MRYRKRGFATIEIFIVSPIILTLGIASTYLLRWLFSTTHWTTWIPTMVSGIPFFVAFGLIVPMIVYGVSREKLRERQHTLK